MKPKLQSKVVVLVAALVLAGASAFAQKPAKTTGPAYNLAGEIKFKGVVDEVREIPESGDTQLVVTTDTKTILVYVGPTNFLKEIEVTFNKGDQVQVTGSPSTGSVEEVILAREITAGTNTFTLRDDKGIPVWTGWKAPK